MAACCEGLLQQGFVNSSARGAGCGVVGGLVTQHRVGQRRFACAGRRGGRGDAADQGSPAATHFTSEDRQYQMSSHLVDPSVKTSDPKREDIGSGPGHIDQEHQVMLGFRLSGAAVSPLTSCAHACRASARRDWSAWHGLRSASRDTTARHPATLPSWPACPRCALGCNAASFIFVFLIPGRAAQPLRLPGRPVGGVAATFLPVLSRHTMLEVSLMVALQGGGFHGHTSMLNQRASVLRSARYSCSSLLQSHAQECRKIQDTIFDEPSDVPTRKLLDLWRAGGEAAAHGFAAGCSSRRRPTAVSAAARNPAARQPAQAAQEIDISSDGAVAGAGAGSRRGRCGRDHDAEQQASRRQRPGRQQRQRRQGDGQAQMRHAAAERVDVSGRGPFEADGANSQWRRLAKDAGTVLRPIFGQFC